MALKLSMTSNACSERTTCSPLLRGDGPETASIRVSVSTPLSCSPLLRGDGPETFCQPGSHALQRPCSPLLRGDGPETSAFLDGAANATNLAVPSYGAMALKLRFCPGIGVYLNLAVPSYGAMALKLDSELYLAK